MILSKKKFCRNAWKILKFKKETKGLLVLGTRLMFWTTSFRTISPTMITTTLTSDYSTFLKIRQPMWLTNNLTVKKPSRPLGFWRYRGRISMDNTPFTWLIFRRLSMITIRRIHIFPYLERPALNGLRKNIIWSSYILICS